MTNDITSKFCELDGESSDYEVRHEIMENLSNKYLIEEAQDFKYANFGTKLTRILLPGSFLKDKEIAREILKEREIDYKIKEKGYSIQKEKTKQKLSSLGNFIKNALTYFTNKK